MASHGRYNKMVPYAEAVDIPLIVRWPKHIRAGSKSETLYTPIDHLPTLASMCGLEIPALANGIDLSGHALGRKANEHGCGLDDELRFALGLPGERD